MTIFLIPEPVPFDQRLWERASSLWPEAFHAAGRHRAHLVVAAMDPAKSNAETKALGFAERTPLTTAFLGAVLAAMPGVVAVIWGGKVGRSPEMWLEQSSRAFEAYPDQPFGLWMDIVPFRSGETVGAYTLGLSAFAGREIEFEVDGLDERTVTGRVAQLSAFLIAADPDTSFKNGEVFKPDSEIDHRVAVLHRKSRFNLGPVISFSSLDDRAGRNKTYPIIPPSIAANHPLLIMLAKVGHFDPAHPRNKIGLKPDHYLSEVRLESFDEGLTQALSRMIATDAYAEADISARSALARGDTATAKSVLQPWADEVGQLQGAVMLALMLRDLHMFAPAPHRSP
ncbi:MULTISPECIES: hypothetical protein [Bradyrhizobium]|uniref:hypothetical protein n=1 Tax=Bradyrhizobium TaxID=374 RepID=UPI001FEF8FAB|nr:MULTISPECIES: hypothetical protein [Bradyrhizobium]UWU72524.1 hypothetical protein N2602_18955 [Bradyrhizobium sp. NC92]